MKHVLPLFLALLGACSSTAYAPASETSVRPGINDPFLKNEVDVDGFTEKWEGESREVYVERAKIVARLGLEAGDVVADVGAGTGAFLRDLSRAVGASGRVLALDIAPDFVEHLDARVEREGLTNVDARLCSENSIDLPEGSIDQAFVCNVYHHFEFPRSSMSSIAHALKPGGEVVLVDFERIPGKSRPWILGHVRAGKDVVFAELEAYGFELVEELAFEGLAENWAARFRAP